MKHELGLIRDMNTVRKMGKELAANEFDTPNFQCSTGYLRRAKERNNLSSRTKTTDRQSTIRAYLTVWTPWMLISRTKAHTLGVIKNGCIDGIRCGNLDEFALCPEDKNLTKKHIAPSKALMINSDSLLAKISDCKRVCTVYVYAPMCGWKDC